MIGAEIRGHFAENARNLFLCPESLFQEFSHLSAVPSSGVEETGIERKVSLIVSMLIEPLSIGAMNGHVENGHIHEVYGIVVLHNKFQRFLRPPFRFRGGAEEKVGVCGDARFAKVPEHP